MQSNKTRIVLNKTRIVLVPPRSTLSTNHNAPPPYFTPLLFHTWFQKIRYSPPLAGIQPNRAYTTMPMMRCAGWMPCTQHGIDAWHPVGEGHGWWAYALENGSGHLMQGKYSSTHAGLMSGTWWGKGMGGDEHMYLKMVRAIWCKVNSTYVRAIWCR